MDVKEVTDTDDHKPRATFVLNTAYTLSRSPYSPETGPPVRHTCQKEGLRRSPTREQGGWNSNSTLSDSKTPALNHFLILCGQHCPGGEGYKAPGFQTHPNTLCFDAVSTD